MDGKIKYNNFFKKIFYLKILGKGEFTFWSIGYSGLVTLIVLFVGILIFNKTEKTFVDTV